MQNRETLTKLVTEKSYIYVKDNGKVGWYDTSDKSKWAKLDKWLEENPKGILTEKELKKVINKLF